MKLYLDLHKAQVKPPKPPKVPSVPGGEPASKPEKKTGITQGSSEEYDYVSKQQYAKRPSVAVGETKSSWIVPKGSKLGTGQEQQPEEKSSKEDFAEQDSLVKEEADPEITSDPLHNEEGSQLGIEDIGSDEEPPLTLNMDEGNTRGARTKDTNQEPEETRIDPETQEVVDEAREKTRVTKESQRAKEEAKQLETQRDVDISEDFDALIADLEAGDAAKQKREERVKKEKDVIADVLKDDGTGYEPKPERSVKKPSKTSDTTGEKLEVKPDISRSKDRSGPYDPATHGAQARQNAVQDYAKEQQAYADSKNKFSQAREKHNEAVEKYKAKKEEAELKQKDYNDNKASHKEATLSIKDKIKQHKKRLDDAKEVLKDLKAADEPDSKAVRKQERVIDKINNEVDKEKSKLERLARKEPKKPEKFTEKEPKFTEKEPDAPTMSKPKNEVEHMKWQDHVRGADKTAKRIEQRLKDENLSPNQKKRLEQLHERFSYHAGMHNMPSKEQAAEMRELNRMAKEAGIEEDQDGETSPSKPLTLPTGIGARLGRIGTTVEAGADVAGVVADYAVGGVAKLAAKLLEGDRDSKDEGQDTSAAVQEDSDTSAAANPPSTQNIKPNAGFPTQPAKEDPKPIKDGEAVGSIANPGKINKDKLKDDMDAANKKGKFGKSMRLFLDVNKGIGQRPNVAVDSDKPKERQNSKYDNSFDRNTAGAMGGNLSPDTKEVGKEWKSIEEEDIINTLDSTKKSLDSLVTIYSTDKIFLNNLGYSDSDIIQGKVILKSQDIRDYRKFLVDNLQDALGALKKSL